jgi:hypothetical protein
MKYQFRVRAVNKGGQSKPSDPSDTITAKDRFGESGIQSLLSYDIHFLSKLLKWEILYIVAVTAHSSHFFHQPLGALLDTSEQTTLELTLETMCVGKRAKGQRTETHADQCYQPARRTHVFPHRSTPAAIVPSVSVLPI